MAQDSFLFSDEWHSETRGRDTAHAPMLGHALPDWDQVTTEQRLRAKHLNIMQMKLDLIEVNQRLRKVQLREKELADTIPCPSIPDLSSLKKQRSRLVPTSSSYKKESSKIATCPDRNERLPESSRKYEVKLNEKQKPLVKCKAIRTTSRNVYSVQAKLWSGQEPTALRRLYGVGKPAVRLSSGRLISNHNGTSGSLYRRNDSFPSIRDADYVGTVKSVNLKKLRIMENRLNRLSQRVEREIDALVPGNDLQSSTESLLKIASESSPSEKANSPLLLKVEQHDIEKKLVRQNEETITSASSEPLGTAMAPESIGVDIPSVAIKSAESDECLVSQHFSIVTEEAGISASLDTTQLKITEKDLPEVKIADVPVPISPVAKGTSRRSAACQTSFAGYSNTSLPRPIKRPVYSASPKAPLLQRRPVASPANPSISQVTLRMMNQPTVSHEDLSRLTHRLSSNRITSQQKARRIDSAPRVVNFQRTKNVPYPYANSKVSASIDSLAPASSLESLVLPPRPYSTRSRRPVPSSPLNPRHQREQAAYRPPRQRKDESSVSLGIRMPDRAVYDGHAHRAMDGKSRIKWLMGREGRAKFRRALFGL